MIIIMYLVSHVIYKNAISPYRFTVFIVYDLAIALFVNFYETTMTLTVLVWTAELCAI